MVEILVAELKQADEETENELIFQGVMSPVLILLSKNGKLLNVLQHADLSLNCLPRLQENVQGHAAEKSNQITGNDVYQIVLQSYPYREAMMTITRMLNIQTPCFMRPSA